MWYFIWFVGMGVTLACVINFNARLEAKSVFDVPDQKAN